MNGGEGFPSAERQREEKEGLGMHRTVSGQEKKQTGMGKEPVSERLSPDGGQLPGLHT